MGEKLLRLSLSERGRRSGAAGGAARRAVVATSRVARTRPTTAVEKRDTGGRELRELRTFHRHRHFFSDLVHFDKIFEIRGFCRGDSRGFREPAEARDTTAGTAGPCPRPRSRSRVPESTSSADFWPGKSAHFGISDALLGPFFDLGPTRERCLHCNLDRGRPRVCPESVR